MKILQSFQLSYSAEITHFAQFPIVPGLSNQKPTS